MNRDDPDRVEPLIHAYLRDQARTIDAGPILAAIRSRRAEAARARGRGRFAGSSAARVARRLAVGVAATLLILGFAWSSRLNSAQAAAVRLVREARAALATSPPDRAYRIKVELAPGMAERAPYLAALARFDCRLWTRSDRFWIEGRRDEQVWATGRDARRHVWVAPDRDRGIDFPPADLPGPLDEAFDLFQFDLDSTLQLLATDFEVTALDGPSGVIRVRGIPRADRARPRLAAITVAIDKQTKIVRQVILAKTRNGRAVADVWFTRDGSGRQPDAAYQLASHLDTQAPVYGPDQRLRRRRVLLRFFGSLLLKGE